MLLGGGYYASPGLCLLFFGYFNVSVCPFEYYEEVCSNRIGVKCIYQVTENLINISGVVCIVV